MSLFPPRRGRHSLRRRRRAVIAAERLERRLAMSASTETGPAAWAVADAAMSAKVQLAAAASPMPIDAPRWVVRLAPGTDAAAAAAAAAAAGAAVSTPTGLLPDTFIWEFPATAAAAFGRSVTAAARELPHDVVSAYPLVARQQAKKLVPNDPLFANQWHLRNTGQGGGTAGVDANVTGVWDTYLGTGVVIGIVDDGLQRAHADLAPNYIAAFSRDFNDNDADPTPLATDGHGTSAAGVAAARGNNTTGVSGAAPRASLAGLRLIAAPTDDAQEATGLSWLPQDIDIYSNSWGPNDSGAQLEGPGPLTLAALEQGVRTGRGGLGSIYVWAAGNGLANNDNVNYDGYANSRYTIAVTAITNRGVQASYAEPGAAILVAAPSSGGTRDISTTDLVGPSGYNTSTSANGGDYTDTFGGTSSATPLVSGVVALMLEANPDLSWRDVQHVLVGSARRNDPTDTGWAQNGVGRWVNHKYGFGAVDAAAAVALAETWAPVGPEVKVSSGTQVVGRAIPDNNAVGVTSSFTVSSGISTEWVEVTFAATHPYRGDLEVVLTSPSGTSSVLAEPHADSGDNYTNWTFTSARNWGETSAGTWTLTVRDRNAADVGTWTSWSLDIYGTEVPPSVAISNSTAQPSAIGGSSTVTFAFSEAVTGFTVADVSVTGGAISGFSGSGATYTATFTPQAAFAGNAQISVAAGTFTDINGNANVTDASLEIAVDTFAPTLTIARGGVGTLKVGNTDTITFTLSEPSTNFVLADVSVAGGTLSNFTGTGAVYTATFTPAADLRGPATVSVAAAKFTDAAGNPNIAAATLSIPVDTVSSTVTITRTGTATLGIGSTDTITFTLSESATDFAASDVTVTGGTLSGFTGLGTVYAAVFTPAAAFSGTATVAIAAGTFTNASGNPNKSVSLGIAVDTVPPTLMITRIASGTVKIGDTPTITFTLSEASSNFTLGDAIVTGGSLSNFSGSGTSYTATFTPTTAFAGSAMISVSAGTFTDSAGNANVVPAGLAIAIDTVPPTVSITWSGSGALQIGDTPTIMFTLSEASTDFDDGDVFVTGGTLSDFAPLSDTIYTATFTPDAANIGTATVFVAAGAFTDPAGNANTAAGSLSIAVAPRVIGFSSSPVTRATLYIGDSILIVAEFSEPIVTDGSIEVQLNSGAVLQLVVDPDGLTARGSYTVQPGEVAADLDVVALGSIDSLENAAGSSLASTLPTTGNNLAERCDIVVDGAVKLRDPGDGFSVDPARIRDVGSVQRISLRFTTPVSGVTVGSFRLWLNGTTAWPLQGARLEGSRQAYTLLLPVSRIRPFGIYRLDIAPGASIRATANGALVSSATSLYWGNRQSVGMLPDAPSGLVAQRVTPVRGKTAVALAWQAAAGRGGGPVTEYVVDYRVAGTSTWLRVRTAISGPGTTIQGLMAGRIYEFRVAAKNAAGIGSYALTSLFLG